MTSKILNIITIIIIIIIIITIITIIIKEPGTARKDAELIKNLRLGLPFSFFLSHLSFSTKNVDLELV